MKINKIQIHQEKISMTMKQEEIEELILTYVTQQANFRIDKDTIKNIIFTREDCGASGFKTRVRIELSNNILPVMKGIENPLPVEY